MSTFQTIRDNNIAVSIETLKLIETEVLEISRELSTIQIENRIANAVAIYCAERTADRLESLGDKIDQLPKGPV